MIRGREAVAGLGPAGELAPPPPVTRPVTEEESGTEVAAAPPWVTILWNCDCHTFEQVARQLMRAIGCSHEEGMAIAWRVHHDGKAVVWVGARDACDRVAAVRKLLDPANYQ